MGCWFHAKKIRVTEYDEAGGGDLDDEDDEFSLDGEGVEVTYLVADHDSADTIDIEVNGNSYMSPHLALRVADAIRDVHKWTTTKAGKKEIERLRTKHAERDEADRKAQKAKKRASQTGSADK